MVYDNTINLTRYGEVGQRVLRNLRKFMKEKSKAPDCKCARTHEIFDQISVDDLNSALSTLMPGLSAKVFRTYNASVTLEAELEKLSPDTPLTEKVSEYNRANREVAILCNHQKAVSQKTESSLQQFAAKIDTIRAQLEELKAARANAKKAVLKAKRDPAVLEAEAAKKGLVDATLEVQEKAKKMGIEIAAAGVGAGAGAGGGVSEGPTAELIAKHTKLHLQKLKFDEKHLFASRQPTTAELDKRIEDWTKTLEQSAAQLKEKDNNKAVALGTSKINYVRSTHPPPTHTRLRAYPSTPPQMDPRITAAWCKATETPIEKCFPATLVKKFPWALGVPSTWKF